MAVDDGVDPWTAARDRRPHRVSVAGLEFTRENDPFGTVAVEVMVEVKLGLDMADNDTRMSSLPRAPSPSVLSHHSNSKSSQSPLCLTSPHL